MQRETTYLLNLNLRADSIKRQEVVERSVKVDLLVLSRFRVVPVKTFWDAGKALLGS